MHIASWKELNPLGEYQALIFSGRGPEECYKLGVAASIEALTRRLLHVQFRVVRTMNLWLYCSSHMCDTNAPSEKGLANKTFHLKAFA